MARRAEPLIRLYQDRIAIVGMTESGKSEIARHLFELARCRRLLVDPKGSWRVEGVEPVREVRAIDWQAPVIHFQPRWSDRDQADELYGSAFRQLRHALIWTDEAYGVSQAGWQGSMVAAINTQGRELEIGHIVCVQRPVNIRRELFSEANHLFLVPPLDERDIATAREGFAFVSLDEVTELLHDLPMYGYLWLDRRQRVVRVGDPMPEHLRRPSLVFRRGERAA